MAEAREAAKSKRTAWLASAAVIFVGAILAAAHLRDDVDSYALLVHFADPAARGPLLDWATRAVTTEDVKIPSPNGVIVARLYVPGGVERPYGIVALHGIHHLGRDEPRLVSFARAVAGEGYAVLTPELTSLADYRVDATSIPAIGDSAIWLEQRLQRGPPTIVGISFAGGLSLLAATEPQYAPHIRALVLMGAYDDLERVSRFLVTSQAQQTDGTWIPYQAHDYGSAVFVYAHLAQFFPQTDLPVANEALRDWLWEQPQNAQPLLPRLSPPSRDVITALMARRIDQLRPQLLSAIDDDRAELASLSPQGHMATLHTPVYILHGSTDDIIPSTESLWLAKDLPRDVVKEVLITPAFSHVDPEKDMGTREKLRLVQFIAEVLRAAR